MIEKARFYNWKKAFEEEFEERGKKTEGLTRKQRLWVHRAWRAFILDKFHPDFRGNLRNPSQLDESDLYVCAFPVERNEEIQIHGILDKNVKAHVHHIMPKRYARYALRWDEKKINHPLNLIPLCELHHVGKGWEGSLDWRNELVPVVHPDIEWARRRYKGKKVKPTSYDFVFEGRDRRVEQALTYWNTDWDFLWEKAEEVYHWYLNFQLETWGDYVDKFPYNENEK